MTRLRQDTLLLLLVDDPVMDVAAVVVSQCVCIARDTHPLLLQISPAVARRVALDTVAGNPPHAPTLVVSDAPAKSIQHQAAFGINLD